MTLNEGETSLWDRICWHRDYLRRAQITPAVADAYISAWLPRHYPNGLGYPFLDYGYIRDIQDATRGGVFLDSGSLHNAKLDRQRLANTPWQRRET